MMTSRGKEILEKLNSVGNVYPVSSTEIKDAIKEIK